MEEKKMLNEEELNKVAGGTTEIVKTQMLCYSCGHEELWEGDYMRKFRECPNCHAQNFKGVGLLTALWK